MAGDVDHTGRPIDRRGRDTDEKYLRWIKSRIAGQSLSKIARQWGVTVAGIGNATNAIRDADIAESGEPIRAVQSKYWRDR
jgi:hypothetical protein